MSPPLTSCECLSGGWLRQRIRAAWLPWDGVLGDTAPNAREDRFNEDDVGHGDDLVDLRDVDHLRWLRD
jgi:hypothetical protein